MTKREELIALGSALYLLGIELEASREKMEKLFCSGYTLHSPEMLDAHKVFARQSTEFATLEKRFLELKEQMGEML